MFYLRIANGYSNKLFEKNIAFLVHACYSKCSVFIFAHAYQSLQRRKQMMIKPIRTGGAAADCGFRTALLIELEAQIL